MTASSTRIRRAACGLSAALALALAPGTPSLARPVAEQAGRVAAPTPGSNSGGDPYFPLYGNGGINVSSYDLNVRYNPTTDVLTGRATLRIRAAKDLSRFNLDLVGLTVRSVTVGGRKAGWKRSRDHELTITPSAALRKNARFTVVIAYDGKPRKNNSSLGSSGFHPTPDGAIAVGQPEAAAFWFPVNDHPKDKATYRITLTVPKALQTISNGLPSATVVSGDWATTTWQHKHPMASYLAFMAVGRFDVRRYTAAGLPIIDAVDPSIPANVRRAINTSFALQGRILTSSSQWFGPYPFETAGGVVDNVQLGFALENQTRPIYDPRFWGDEKEAFVNDSVVVHELAHQWYGDSVALQRWQDIWLNEGFATYAEWMWVQQEDGISTADIFDDFYDNIPASEPFWKVRIGDPGPDRVFDYAVYARGAMTLEGLRQKVGRDTFLKILQTWTREHRDGHGTTKQFITLAERISKRQLDAHFNAWLNTASRPPRPANARRNTSKAQRQAARAYVLRWHADLQRRLAAGHHR